MPGLVSDSSCPDCGASLADGRPVRMHCQSPTCPWIVCEKCNGYGYDSGHTPLLWAQYMPRKGQR